MNAIVWTQYGSPDGLQLDQVDTPRPRDRELLIRIRATTVTAGDCELRALRFSLGLRLLFRLLMGLARPRRKILGQEFAGVVEAVGKGVRLFRIGDGVVGTTGLKFGAYAEYICLPERARGIALAAKPRVLTYEEAATIPTGGLEALHLLRQAGDLRGRKVLIRGAGGGIGMFAVQLAKDAGARVTGIDRTERLDLVRSLGADSVLDHAGPDFTLEERAYDVVLDVVGRGSVSALMKSLAGGGRYIAANPSLSAVSRGWWSSLSGRRTVKIGAASHRSEDLAFLARLFETHRLRVVIDRTFPLAETPAAHRYFESGVPQGRVVIQV